jgi:hypothetical protein
MSPLDPSYKEVSDRIRDFRKAHPDGTLQSEYLGSFESPEASFIIVKALAYRTSDDPRPGIGLAWERVPGLTNFTKNSELQNAETSAWGRAIIAVGASDAKHVASANEVRNREAEQERAGGPFPRSTRGGGREQPDLSPAKEPARSPQGNGSFPSPRYAPVSTINQVRAFLRELGYNEHDERVGYLSTLLGREVDSSAHLTLADCKKVLGIN